MQAQRERKHRKKKVQKARSRILDALKVPQPSKWDGTVNLDKFDTWVYEVRTWQKLAEISDDIALCLMPRFLSGKPQTFFMRHVADSESKWSMHALFEALFDYCFPKDYKATLRAQLESARQGSRTVRDFVRDIQYLAIRFPDVTDFQLAQIFW